MAQQPLPGPAPPQCRRFKITDTHTHTLGRTRLDEWSARRRDLTTHDSHKKQTPMLPAGIKHAIPAGDSRSPRGHWNRPLSTYTQT
jgi:hypothetical protein